MFSGLSSRKNKRARKQKSLNRTKFGRRFRVEPLEDRSLLSVSLGNPTAASWSYGQSESISAAVVNAGTLAPPALGAEVDLVNASPTAGAANPILVKGYTSDANGNVSFNLTALNVGAYNLEAEFTDSLGAVETSNVVPVAVALAPTTTILASSDPAPVYGEPLTITATVASGDGGIGTPTGCVVFTVDGNASETFSEKLNGGGVATLTIPNTPVTPTPTGATCLPAGLGLKVGQHTITAVYEGDADFSQSTATPLCLTVAQASTTTALTSSPDGAACIPFGQPIVFNATVQVVAPGTGIPSGFVSFVDTSTPTPTVLGKAYVAWSPKAAAANTGVASFVNASLPVGTHTIVAYYQGSQDYMASDTSAVPESVTIGAAASNTMAWAGPNPAVFDAPVTISAVVLPGAFGPVPVPVLATVGPGGNPVLPPIFNAPTGSVQFLDNGSDLGAPVPLVNGAAQLTAPYTDPLRRQLDRGLAGRHGRDHGGIHP